MGYETDVMNVLLVLTFSVCVCPVISQGTGFPMIPNGLLSIFASMQSSNANCPAVCTPQWMKLLQMFNSAVSLRPNGELCEYAKNESLFTSCQPNLADPSLRCRTNEQLPVFFNCCPRNCVEAILSCVDSNIQNICIPSMLQPWQTRIMEIYVRSQSKLANARNTDLTISCTKRRRSGNTDVQILFAVLSMNNNSINEFTHK